MKCANTANMRQQLPLGGLILSIMEITNMLSLMVVNSKYMQSRDRNCPSCRVALTTGPTAIN